MSYTDSINLAAAMAAGRKVAEHPQDADLGPHKLNPYTYWRDTTGPGIAGMLLVDIRREGKEPHVILQTWGSGGLSFGRFAFDAFVSRIKGGRYVEFTPKLVDHAGSCTHS